MSKPSALPAPLAQATRRFEEWRRNRTSPRIPGELWTLAADLGARYGVSRTARALRLQFYDLKKRVAVATTADPQETEAPPAFVEILTAPWAAAAECLVEFENPSGAKMRIQTRGANTMELATLSRLFLGSRP